MKLTKPGILIALSTSVFACAGTTPENLGVTDQHLQPCPSSPNCVVSFNYDENHYIEPIKLAGDISEKKAKIIALLRGKDEAKIISEQPAYIRAEFTSRIMRFVDDVEFYITVDAIHIRSASRVGYGDMGVNRKRMEAIRAALTQ
jgi:uncharacterized protein (DUF1499 family)